uniref:Calcineurin-like phosphoesterase domain-containing protein n=1 Tax=Phaeomonas parva TaxID=124430 RepID=A0A7S1XKA1_9STRA|mmetsp:Transcript_11678/g.35442  ORF Transcript_11678/g.35442 Transcript_11678/m.35442 type:complete len:221 (+) Transcript_11678:522-1184(+)
MADGTTVLLVALDTWRINGGDTWVAYDSESETMRLRDPAKVQQDVAAGVLEEIEATAILEAVPPYGVGEEVLEHSKDDEQLDWLRETLAGSDADWKVVFGHYPVRSATLGEHGDTPSLVEDVLPILQSEGVDIYFAGHDHVLEHISKDGLHHFGSGSGAKIDTGMDKAYEGLLGFHVGHYGFMRHTGDKTKLKTDFVDDTGSVVYTYTIEKGDSAATTKH